MVTKYDSILLTHNHKTLTLTQWGALTKLRPSLISHRMEKSTDTDWILRPTHRLDKKCYTRNERYTWDSWSNARLRCYVEITHAYEMYGGRGIRMCDRWLNSFENFLKDMGRRPEGTTIDRIDTNGHYSPENCRWATPSEQGSNQRPKSKYKNPRRGNITYNGRTMSAREWADEYNMKPSVFRCRFFRYNWTMAEAVGDEKRPARKKREPNRLYKNDTPIAPFK